MSERAERAAIERGEPGAVATSWVCTRCKGVSTTPGDALRHECPDRKAERELVAFLCERETREAIDGGRKLYETAPPSFVWGDPVTGAACLSELLARIDALDGAALAGPAKED